MYFYTLPLHEMNEHSITNLLTLIKSGSSLHEINLMDTIIFGMEIAAHYSSEDNLEKLAQIFTAWVEYNDANDLFLTNVHYNADKGVFVFEVDPSYEIFINEGHGLVIDREDKEGYHVYDVEKKVWSRLEMLKGRD